METVKEKLEPGKTLQLGMTSVIVQHEVTNYDKWVTIFKAQAERREKASIKELYILRGEANPNLLNVVLRLDNIADAKAFFDDPQTSQVMREAGVTSKPSFTYFKVTDSGSSANPAYLVIQHKVGEYNKWKEAFDQHESVRSTYDIHLVAVGKDLDDPSNVVAIFNSRQSSNFTDFLEKSNLKEVMHDAGVMSEPVVSTFNKVS